MPNTTLPTSITPNVTTGISDDLEVVNVEINRMSRDTGWCDVLGFLKNGWTATTAKIRRQDDTVAFEVSGLNGTAATSPVLFTFGADESDDISSNFAVDGPFRTPMFGSTSGGFTLHFYGNPSSGLSVSWNDGEPARAASSFRRCG